jgi:hypothetical protein
MAEVPAFHSPDTLLSNNFEPKELLQFIGFHAHQLLKSDRVMVRHFVVVNPTLLQVEAGNPLVPLE